MLQKLDKKERMLLLKFVCAFAWADLEVKASERRFVHRLVKQLALGKDEAQQVEEWLKVPPKPEEVDPNRIPRGHKDLFLDAARRIIAADGEIDAAEKEDLELLEQLLV
ncbi:MAG: TerB family tellurite resistance protein [Myxococcales bacterium]|nr:TerB family tellurite resistance protein [Myxococcales bacterium]MCB9582913.1 TerB family tellurite resistance protein [Polyangiaceae bacterium]